MNNVNSPCNLVEFAGPQTGAIFKVLLGFLLSPIPLNWDWIHLLTVTVKHIIKHLEFKKKKRHFITTITKPNTLTLSSAFYQKYNQWGISVNASFSHTCTELTYRWSCSGLLFGVAFPSHVTGRKFVFSQFFWFIEKQKTPAFMFIFRPTSQNCHLYD